VDADVELTTSEVFGDFNRVFEVTRGLGKLKTSRNDVKAVDVMMVKRRRDVYLPHLLKIKILSDGGVAFCDVGMLPLQDTT
jgi:hypothetical protein